MTNKCFKAYNTNRYIHYIATQPAAMRRHTMGIKLCHRMKLLINL